MGNGTTNVQKPNRLCCVEIMTIRLLNRKQCTPSNASTITKDNGFGLEVKGEQSEGVLLPKRLVLQYGIVLEGT